MFKRFFSKNTEQRTRRYKEGDLVMLADGRKAIVFGYNGSNKYVVGIMPENVDVNSEDCEYSDVVTVDVSEIEYLIE